MFKIFPTVSNSTSNSITLCHKLYLMKEKLIMNIKEKLNRPIVLVGMMGAGKSYLGHALADALSLALVDSDAEIEKQEARSISDIFAKDGEPAFRAIERDVITSLLQRPPQVIATGGGAVVTPETLTAMEQQGLMIWLNPSLQTIWGRIAHETHRPLLACDNPQDVLQDLMDKRRDLYGRAHIHIDDSADSVDHILEKIAEHLNR